MGKHLNDKGVPLDAIYNDSPSLTEQEHKDSCDINLMLKSASRGQQVRGYENNNYGYEDMNADLLTIRIEKAGLEEKLLNGQKEFTEEELSVIPKHIQEKFGFTLKKQAETPKAPNDDSTTKQPQQSKPKKQQKPETPPSDPTEEA